MVKWGIVSSSEESGIWNQPLQIVEVLRALDSPLGELSSSYRGLRVAATHKDSRPEGTVKSWGSLPSPGADFAVQTWLTLACWGFRQPCSPECWGANQLRGEPASCLNTCSSTCRRFYVFNTSLGSGAALGSTCLPGAKGPPATGLPFEPAAVADQYLALHIIPEETRAVAEVLPLDLCGQVSISFIASLQ